MIGNSVSVWLLLSLQSILHGDSVVGTMSLQSKAGVNNHDEGVRIQNDSSSSTDTSNKRRAITKRILMIRHGTSLGNVMMSRPGNEWGSPNFTDDATLVDSPLSKDGVVEAQELAERLQHDDDKRLHELEAIIVSPLTRTIQTMQYGVLPLLEDKEGCGIPIIAQPLATERVYTTSDTGRLKEEIAHQFQNSIPNLDLSLLPEDAAWWFHRTTDEHSSEEWRPHDAQQYYGVPGEPKDIFEDRMRRFELWLSNLPYDTVCLVTHWGVLRHVVGTDFHNCEAKWIDWKLADSRL